MAKSFDPPTLTAAVIQVVESLVSQKTPLPSSEPAKAVAKETLEYEDRMRVNGMDKFDAPSFISAVSLYANAADMQRDKAKGAVALYMNAEFADKIYKSIGYTIPYDEDDETMLKLGAEFCQAIVKGVMARITSAGYAELTVSQPAVAKNSIQHGVAFSPDQHEHQEVSFFYFKNKAIVVEISLVELPRK